ncbi:MAG TPA: YlbF family regulator [Syntrophomonas sp.]|nr:YlbF family regulator [Syntrophomonas sp.]HRW12504.1 YlbF family regulator [Syntrophomonas sp.]
MTTEEIIKMAYELGNAIAQSKEVDALREMQVKLGDDADAFGLIMRYQEAQTQMENKLQDGLQVTAAEEKNIEIMEEEINNNPLIQELIKVQEKFDSLMQGVYFAMNQAISGSDTCSSGCDSCGGGCGVM